MLFWGLYVFYDTVSLFSSYVYFVNINMCNSYSKRNVRQRLRNAINKSYVNITSETYNMLNCIMFYFFNRALYIFIHALCIIKLSGDVELNPGPISINQNSSRSSLGSHDSLDNETVNCENLSIVHYNVQSVNEKIDLINCELNTYDIIALTETWLDETVDNEKLSYSRHFSL